MGVQRDEQAPGVAAGGARGEGRFLRGEDVAPADEDGDVAQRGREGDVSARSRERGLVVPVVVDFAALGGAGEDAVHRAGALLEHGGDEQRRAEEELPVGAREGGVVREFPRQRPHHGAARAVREVE